MIERKNVFKIISVIITVICCAFTLIACGDKTKGNNTTGGDEENEPTVSMTESYGVAMDCVQQWFGIAIPEKENIEVSFDIGNDSFCFDMVGGNGLSVATFTEFAEYFDTLFDIENSTEWEKDSGEEYANYNNETLGKGINLYLDTYNDAVYLNLFYNNATFDKYAVAKAQMNKILGIALPDISAVKPTYFHAQLYNSVFEFGYYNVDDSENIYNTLKTCLDNLTSPWSEGNVSVPNNYSRTIVEYYNYTNGAKILLSWDSGDGRSVTLEAGLFGNVVATTIAQARNLFADVYGIEIPAIDGAILGDNSFALTGNEVTFSVSGAVLTKQYCIGNIEAVFTELFGAGEVTCDDENGRGITWVNEGLMYAVSWTPASENSEPTLDIDIHEYNP